jgi:SAM-dependent methyltransferase
MQKINLEDIRSLLLNPELSEKKIIKSIEEISFKFTQKRSEIKDYVLDEDLVSSYALFYLPTNIPKFDFIFENLNEEVQQKILKSTFVDVGCGPGTYAYAISRYSNAQKIICVDSARLMLNQAEKILTNKFKQHVFQFEKRIDRKIENSTLFFGNSINEMGIQKALDIVNIVDPEIIMFIEPGTSELFLELKQIRETLTEYYDVIFPCPSNASCPYDWCHQVLRTTHALDVERLSQLVSLDRKILPLTSHVYVRKSHQVINDERLTIIRFLNETKFSFMYEVCGELNNENQIYKIEIMKKNMTKENEKAFKNLNVGERVIFHKEKMVGDFWRGHVD